MNVNLYESSSREEGRGGRRWEISFTSLGLPPHVGEIQVKRGSLFGSVTCSQSVDETVFFMHLGSL